MFNHRSSAERVLAGIGGSAILLVMLFWGLVGVCQPASVYLGKDKIGFNWMPVSGRADDLAINAAGQVVVVDPNGNVWQWGKVFPHTWDRLGGDFRRVALAPGGSPWAVDRAGRIARYKVGWWAYLPGRAVDIASAGTRNKPYLAIADPHGRPLRWDARSRGWVPFPSKDKVVPDAVRIALGAHGTPWVVTAHGAIWRLHDQRWRRLPGTASDISVGPLGHVYITTPVHALLRWNRVKRRWTPIAGIRNARAVALGPQGKPWYVTTGASIRASDLFEHKPATGGAVAKARTSRARRGSLAVAVTSLLPIRFVRVSGYAQQVAIGARGSVFVTGADGDLARWSQLNKAFVQFPGRLSRVAVDPQGLPWGLNGGSIYHFDGTRWNRIPGSATDIAVGYDGTVMIVGAQDRLYRYNPEQNRFLAMPRQFHGSRIAVDPQGHPWLIRDHVIYHCVQDGCARTPLKGNRIAIGPDGSVFMVGLDRHLYRWDAAKLNWSMIDTPIAVSDVAVGPYGRPWVVDQGGDIYASRFFYRDERDDATQIADAAYRSNDSPASTFTFTKSLLFTRVPLPDGPNACALALKVGANDRIYLLKGCAGPFGLYVYNRASKRFESSPIQPPNVGFASAQSDGRLWYQEITSLTCFRQRTIGENSFAGVLLDGSHGRIQSYCRDLAVGADDSVFVVASSTAQPFADYLYRYDKQTGRFALFSDRYSFLSVGVDPQGNPWVVTSDHRVWRYDGNVFVPLPGHGKPQKRDGEHIAVGPTGVVYLVDTTGRIFKWNKTNTSFDRVDRSHAWNVAVDGDGRPWVIDATSPYQLFRAQ